jgi:uncharacterized membrane protein
MIALIEWHPLAVHFPLALEVTGAAALSAARLDAVGRNRPALATVGTWNLCLGALGMLAAVATGLAAVASLDLDAAARIAVGTHVKWAVFSTIGLLVIATWRGAGSDADARPSRLFLGFLWAATAALIVTGYHGGQNVYRYGVGVAPESAAGLSK